MQPLYLPTLGLSGGVFTYDGMYKALHAACPRPCELSGRNGKRSMACRAEKLSKEDLIRLAGSKKVAEEALKSEPANETYEIPFEGIPHKPKFAIPNPKRGERFAAYHRETRGIFKKKGSMLKTKPIWPEPTLPEEPIYDDPVPWNPAKRLPPPPVITFPEKRPLYVDKKVFQWERKGFIPYFEKLYPDPVVEVEVTITNDPEVADQWALARKTAGVDVYGFDTKFWTYDEKGVYYTDSHPGEWSDLALLQVATQRDILLVQPLDMPVEKLGPQLRSIFSYKHTKKAGSNVMAKAKALKMCDFQFHGAHDHFLLLKRALELSTKRMLPLNVELLDLQGMSMHLLGIDLEAELSATAHWEKEFLDDEMIEVAAKEAWCSWALFGILTRMTRELVILWSKGFPKSKGTSGLAKQRELRRAILLSKSITLEHVREAHILQKSRKSLPKLTKMAAAELVLDAGVDLYESVDQDMLHDRLAGLVEAGGNETEDAEQDDESNSGINQWRGEEVKESWMYYIQESGPQEEVTRIDEPPKETVNADLMEEGVKSGLNVQEGSAGSGWEQPAKPTADDLVESVNREQSFEAIAGDLDDGKSSAWVNADLSSLENIFEEELSAVDDFDQAGELDERASSGSSENDSDDDESAADGSRDSQSGQGVYSGSRYSEYSDVVPDVYMRKMRRQRTRKPLQRTERENRDMSTSSGRSPMTYSRWVETSDEHQGNQGRKRSGPKNAKKKEGTQESDGGALDEYDFGAMIDAW